ncbi:MAG TPA: hypothetical protein VMZ92_00715 [Planctomycetota bacterium]|nr:hypothetical protein [Planctomycetota bacterium]
MTDAPTPPENSRHRLRMVGCGLLTATLLCLPAGCTSDRDRRLKEYRQMHRDIREEPEHPAGDWTLKSKE